MKIFEAIAAVVGVPGVSNNAIELAAINADLDIAANYTKNDNKNVELAAATVLDTIILDSVGEGGFSFGISVDLLTKRRNDLYDKWGVDRSAQPKVKNAARW